MDGPIPRMGQKIQHKLGHGATSVVWLARDLQASCYVALKILRADASVEEQQSDLLFLRHLNSVEPPLSSCGDCLSNSLRRNDGIVPTSLFPRIVDDFMVHGPNGDHLCVVVEALGVNLGSMLDFADDETSALRSFATSGVNKFLGIPLCYAAPEVLFGDLLTPACDVWSLGCLLFHVLGSMVLWPLIWGKKEIFPNMVVGLGKFPKHWWQQWEERSKYFDDEGHLLPGIRNWGGPINRRLNKFKGGLEEERISEVHLDELERILRHGGF
ncbi:kinase-like domain-containing protein [Trichophaea hybrida]|nr:kinase-like domain-containing protein [Trichophaea hybrida]